MRENTYLELSDSSQERLKDHEQLFRLHLVLDLLQLEFVNLMNLTFQQLGVSTEISIPEPLEKAVLAILSGRLALGSNTLVSASTGDYQLIATL